eukprot:1161969-Pelagomonas_calceolata.AAC.9
MEVVGGIRFYHHMLRFLGEGDATSRADALRLAPQGAHPQFLGAAKVMHIALGQMLRDMGVAAGIHIHHHILQFLGTAKVMQRL